MSTQHPHPNAASEWFARKEWLRQIRVLPDRVESALDGHLTIAQWLQFDRDIRTYGLWEAVMLIRPRDCGEIVQSVIGHVYNWFTPESRPVPNGRKLDDLPHTGTIIPQPPVTVPITPRVTWFVRKDEIVARQNEMLAKACGDEPDKRWLERMVSVVLRERPHLVARCEQAILTNVWDGILTLPADVRENAMARVIKKFDIPPASDWFNTREHLFPKWASRDVSDKQKTFLSDVKGNAWHWNMGWRMVDEKGNVKHPSRPPLGHLTFRRHIKLADAASYRNVGFKYTRPWGEWRRGAGHYAHPTLGNVEVILTDGVHCVVKNSAGLKAEVQLSNLTTIGTAIPRKLSEKIAAVKAPRAKRSALTDQDKAEIDAFIANL